MNPDKCCFCNADMLGVIRWSVVVQEISTMGIYAAVPNIEQQRHLCNECMAKIKEIMDELEGGIDSATREGE